MPETRIRTLVSELGKVVTILVELRDPSLAVSAQMVSRPNECQKHNYCDDLSVKFRRPVVEQHSQSSETKSVI